MNPRAIDQNLGGEVAEDVATLIKPFREGLSHTHSRSTRIQQLGMADRGCTV